MRGLLQRSIETIPERLVVLSAPRAEVPGSFRRVTADSPGRTALLRQVQRLRGRVYFQDGAVLPHELTADGRHEAPEDARSWHLVMLDRRHRPTACLWYLEHDGAQSIEDLRVRSTPPATMAPWSEPLRESLASEIGRARAERVAYSEVGGWATDRYDRCCPDGLLLILSTFGLSRMLGGALGVTMATVRHSSAAILKRLGLSRFPAGEAVVPPYYDPRYRCEMELLRFDTRRADWKYEPLVRLLMERLPDVRIVEAWPEPTLTVAPAPSVACAGLRVPGVLIGGAAA